MTEEQTGQINPDEPFLAPTVVALLRWRARHESERLAYVHLKDGLTPEQELSYASLDHRIRALAGWLQQHTRAGDRALLLYSRGLDVVIAFWACLYAGVIAIPAPPPDPARVKQGGLRLQSIQRDAQARIVLASSDVMDTLRSYAAELALDSELRCFDTTVSGLGEADNWAEYSPSPESIAYLQYTSGSTSAPKGVMVTHANMASQAALVARASHASQTSRWLTWLPYFHDYGLVHGVIVPVATGSVSYLFSPFTFLRKPLRWLEAISQHKITHSGAPNFAYDLCVRALADVDGPNLSLGSWQVASCGAEPIRESTMASFAARCAPFGLMETALSPAYGMAEYTLMVSIKEPGSVRSVRRLHATALEEGLVVSEDSQLSGRPVVGCGYPAGDTRVLVVDPTTRTVCPPDRVGEFWLAGRSVASGYWGKPDETEQTFQAVLADSGDGPFLRTGDLGFLHDGEIYVTGRRKDLIIIRGRNLYPQDIELTAEQAHDVLRAAGGAAFSVDQGGGEELVIVHEVDRAARQVDLEEVSVAIRQAIAEQHDVFAGQVALVRAGGVPKTSSGKVQRQQCRTAFLTGALPILHLSSHTTSVGQSQRRDLRDLDGMGGAPELTHQSVVAVLRSVLAEQVGIPAESVDASLPIGRLGLDSLMINIIRNRLEDRFGVSPSFSQLLNQWSVEDVSAYILANAQAGSAEAKPQPLPPVASQGNMEGADFYSRVPLSKAQQRVWFLEQLHSGTSINHLVLGIRLRGELQVPLLRQGLDRLVERHEMLRARFHSNDGRTYADIRAQGTYEFNAVTLLSLDKPLQEAEINRIAQREATRPFALEQGPLLRVALLAVGPEEHLLFLTFHRLIADGWSIRIICRDLGRLYAAGSKSSGLIEPLQIRDGASPIIRPHNDCGAHVRETQLAYWVRQLENPPAPLSVPTDYPRLAGGNFKGSVQSEALSEDLDRDLARTCREHNVTRFMVLYAAMAVWLSRWTGCPDSIVGSVVANRRRAELEHRVGYFVNTVALRVDLSRTPTVKDVWNDVRRVVSDAYDHQDVAFEEVVESLNIKRDGGLSPLFKTMIVLEDDPIPDLRLPGVEVSRLPLEVHAAEFDLVLMVLNGAQGCELALVYDEDLFAPATVRRMLAQIQTVLRGMVSQPDSLWKTLPLMPAEERQQVVDGWNATQAPIADLRCVHRVIDGQAKQFPERIAVNCGEVSITYQELASQSDRLALTLGELGVVPGDCVGLYVDRSIAGIVGMLGILKAGAAYVPFDPATPEQRLRFMLDDARVALVLTQAKYEGFIDGLSKIPVTLEACLIQTPDHSNGQALAEVPPETVAYVIYTSGSTGTPKGVEVTHRSLAYSMAARMQYYADPVERCLLTFSFAFDGSVTGIYWTLMQGGTVVIPTEPAHRDVHALIQLISRCRVSHVVWVPSLYEAILREASGNALDSLKVVISAGERLPISLVREHYARIPHAALVNEYGPTEATVWSAVYRTTPDEPGPNVPIGRPIANVQLYVLDDCMQPVPIGAEGELYIGGEGLARGYLHRPELTRERFVPHPFVPGLRVYRTGDVVRRRSDGHLEFLGRSDHQVKLRGYRIELGEIESVLASCPGVQQAAVLLREDRPGQPALVGYVQGVEGVQSENDVRTFLATRLPSSMIPSVFVWLREMPITLSGKLDRKAFPVPAEAREAQSLRRVPQTPIESAILAIWKEVLHVEEIAVGENFFHLGGHSLLVTQVAARIRERFEVELPLRTFFDRPTVDGQAEAIEVLMQDGAPQPEALPMAVVSRQTLLPLSFSQQRMWFMHCLDPAGTAYNMPIAIRVSGKLNRKALKAAVNELIRRHEAFRTTFRLGSDGPLQAIHDSVHLPWNEVDLRLLPPSVRMQTTARMLNEEARKPFDLSSAPLIRLLLIQLGEEEHIVLLNMHHIIGDQWSFGIIGREFGALYSAACQGKDDDRLPPLALQYPDYAVWQRKWLTEDLLQTHLEYWREQLRGVPVLALPTDFPRPKVQRFLGSYRSVQLSDDLLRRLAELAARTDATQFMVLLAAFQMLLSRYCGQTDIAVGVPVANRTHLATEEIVGTFVNTLVLRTEFAGDPTFGELLSRVRRTAVGAFDHQDMPFERLVDELSPKRDLSHSPLVQVLFNVANAPLGKVEFAGLAWAPFEFEGGAAQFDLTLTVDTQLTKQATLSYRTDLFDGNTIDRMIEQYVHLLHELADDPNKPVRAYDILPAVERKLILTEWNKTDQEYPREEGVPRLITMQARQRPAAVAVSMEGAELTYGELESQSNRLASYLRRVGVERGELVGLCIDRSPDMVVGLVGIMKAGAAYVPLDPDYPADRLKHMLDQSGSRVIVTTSDVLDRLPHEGRQAVCLDRDAQAIRRESAEWKERSHAEDLAYVIYTSGSTGKPKGVEISHRALVNFLWSMRMVPGCSPSDVFLAVTTLSFDIAGLELYLPLIVGGRVELASRQVMSDGRLLRGRLEKVRPTMMQATPATWRMLLDAGWSESRQMVALCGGEALSRDLADQLLPRLKGLWNMYGPTETTIWSTLSQIEAGGEEITIGRPIANTHLYILDAERHPAPIGVPGELYIGGDGLARGYCNRPELTGERFIPNPFSSDPTARLYRTGDQARYLRDGRIVHLGRLDQQVKIRGFRIELGEIESALNTHPHIRQSVVVARPDPSGGRQLAAYVTPSDRQAISSGDLRSFLRLHVPDYMVPSSFTFLEVFPLTANGKVDRLALPNPSPRSEGELSHSGRPMSPLEVQLAALWQQVLGHSDVGIHDNFFELGGHSLAAVQLFANLEQVFGKQLPLATLFQAPTIAQLAEVLTQSEFALHWNSLVAIQPMGAALPIFAVPGVGGNVLGFARLAALLGRERPFYGLQTIGLDGRQMPLTSVTAIATRYIEEIRSARPEGPYIILGTCTGGVIAFEIAQQLKAAGENVVLLILESWHPSSYESYRRLPNTLWRAGRHVGAKLVASLATLRSLSVTQWGGFIRHKVATAMRRVHAQTGGVTQDHDIILDRVSQATYQAVATYQTTGYAGTLLNIIASQRIIGTDVVDTRTIWSSLAQDAVSTIPVPAENSGRLFVSPHVEIVADVLREYLEQRSQEISTKVPNLLG